MANKSSAERHELSSCARMVKTLRPGSVVIVLRVRGGFVELARLPRRKRQAPQERREREPKLPAKLFSNLYLRRRERRKGGGRER